MWLNELTWLREALHGAQGPASLFASLRQEGLSFTARQEALDREHRKFSAMCNPERFVDAPAARAWAEDARRRLEDLYHEALALIDAEEGQSVPAGPYRSPQAPTLRREVASIQTSQGLYELVRPLATGDLCSLYVGRCESGTFFGDEVIIKLVRDPADNDLLDREAAALRRLSSGDAAQQKHLPKLLDRFQSAQHQAGHILSRVEGYDLLSVRERYPDGVPPEHVVWMLRRMLSVLGYAHSQGVLHGNLEPSHVLIRPRDHNVTLVDWCYSVIDPSKTGQQFVCLNPEYSAPELSQKPLPKPAADLFSVGKCALFLLGGDLETGTLPGRVDERLQRFVRYLLRPSALQRAQDAWEAFEELGRIRKAIYGAHTFQEFVM